MANAPLPPGGGHHGIAVGLILGFWVLALVVLSGAVALLALLALTGSLQ